MKFNKEKTKKFASGGKTTKKIREEAISSAIARDAANTAARDAVNNSGIAAYQSTPVTIQAPRPTVDLTLPELTQRSDLKSMFKTRGEAFNYARKRGWTDFNWGGGRFHTKTAEEVSGAATSTSKSANTSKNNTSTAQQLIRIGNPANTGFLGPYGKKVDFYDPQKNRQSVNEVRQRDLNTILSLARRIPQHRLNVLVQNMNEELGLITPGVGLPEYQQGGQLPSYQQGGIVSDFKNWISSLVNPPNKYQVNSDIYTTYTKKDPFIGRSSETRSIVGPNGQTSTMIIKGIAEENPAKIDTTFISPGYIKNPDLYPKFTPQDIREGNRKGKGKESYLEKFTSPTYFPHIGKHQQGGKVEAPTDEMYVDFAVRFLSKLGVGEEDMVDEEGGLKDEHAETVTVALQELESTPEFWDTYVSDPDAAVDAYIESKQSPEQIEMARKGAKLKNLQKLKKGTAKKCKCGCDLIIKKEKGGTITEVCSCGCKAK